ncbi:hypothetical protein EV421DRAFT_1948130 [Armillaria borealis]|uniref:DUF6699 domain-containing protein n=1 Tax=Armillaria borealis TaxID=47425 RepID=A0AA39MQG8_9AGAR|nr:hypothetical protein EV421DRAFT_1948130 [Armillaria borealis]
MGALGAARIPTVTEPRDTVPTYVYEAAHIPSQTATYLSQRLFQRPSTSQQHSYIYYHSRSLNDTPSPEYDHSPLSSSQALSSSPTSHTSQSRPSVLPPSRPVSTQPPPTPDGLRHPITLPPVTEGPDTPITSELHEYLRPLHLDIDLSQDISPYIWTLPDELATSPYLPANMILISNYLPWRIHISPSSVGDLVVALYTALRTRVTDKEMKAVGGKYVMKSFAKRVEGAGEEESKKGVRRVDFLLGSTRFVGIEPTDGPGVWKLCFLSLS